MNRVIAFIAILAFCFCIGKAYAHNRSCEKKVAYFLEQRGCYLPTESPADMARYFCE